MVPIDLDLTHTVPCSHEDNYNPRRAAQAGPQRPATGNLAQPATPPEGSTGLPGKPESGRTGGEGERGL